MDKYLYTIISTDLEWGDNDPIQRGIFDTPEEANKFIEKDYEALADCNFKQLYNNELKSFSAQFETEDSTINVEGSITVVSVNPVHESVAGAFTLNSLLVEEE